MQLLMFYILGLKITDLSCSNGKIIQIGTLSNFRHKKTHFRVKNFMDPLRQVVKKHRVPKIGIFVHCSVSECLANQEATVLELSLLAAVFELNRTN